MKITPLDIRRKEFRRSMRGYSDEEVDIFLDEVADEFERLFQENMELQERSQRLDEQISGDTQLREALEKTLIAAQLQSEEIRANAHKESELILRDAQQKARGIVNDSYSETQKAQQTLVKLKRLEEEFRFKFRSLLEGYLKLLDDAAIAAAETEAATTEDEAATVAGGAVPEAPRPTPETPVPAPKAPAPARQTQAAAPRDASPAPVSSSPAPGGPAQAPRVQAPESPARAPEAPKPPADAPPVARAAPASAGARPFVPAPEDEVPTEENELSAPGAPEPGKPSVAKSIEQVVSDAVDEVTAESVSKRPASPPGETVSDDSLRGFFFGRQMEDIDDTFSDEDGIKRQEGREFEW